MLIILDIFLTNNNNPFKIPHDDRRFAGIECCNKLANNKNYFTALYDEINSKVYDRSFYNYFLSIDLNKIDFTNDRPITSFYNNMKEMNTPVMAKFFEQIVDDNIEQENIKYSATDLFNAFNEYVRNNNFKMDMSSTKFGIDIKNYEGIEKKKTKTVRLVIIHIPTLKEFLRTKYNIEFNNEFIDDEQELKYIQTRSTVPILEDSEDEN